MTDTEKVETPPAAKKTAAKKTAAKPESAVYAVYDLDRAGYYGGTWSTKDEAKAYANDKGIDRYDVVDVSP